MTLPIMAFLISAGQILSGSSKPRGALRAMMVNT